MDANSLVFVPRWVKTVSFLILFTVLSTSIVVINHFLNDSTKTDWILVAMSSAQVASSGLIVFLFVAFTQRAASVASIRAETDDFLVKILPSALLKIDTPPPKSRSFYPKKISNALPNISEFFYRKTNVSITVEHNSGDIGAFYEINLPCGKLRMFSELNLWRAVIVYYFYAESDIHAKELSQLLSYSFDGMRSQGWDVCTSYTREGWDERMYLNYIMVKNLDKSFLRDNHEKLFFANDVMLHTKGLVRNCKRLGIIFPKNQ